MFIGLLLTTAGVRNTQSDLYSLLKGDFTGNGNFSFWVISIIAIGSLGYVKELKQFSNYFLVLIFTSMLLAEEKANGGGGFFAKINDALKLGLTPDNAGVPDVKPNSRALEPLPDLGTAELLKNPGGLNYLYQLQDAWQKNINGL